MKFNAGKQMLAWKCGLGRAAAAPKPLLSSVPHCAASHRPRPDRQAGGGSCRRTLPTFTQPSWQHRPDCKGGQQVVVVKEGLQLGRVGHRSHARRLQREPALLRPEGAVISE